MTFPLKDLPIDVDLIVRKEQVRIELEEGKKLKKEHVYYQIVREWSKLQTIKNATNG